MAGSANAVALINPVIRLKLNSLACIKYSVDRIILKSCLFLPCHNFDRFFNQTYRKPLRVFIKAVES